MRYETNQTGYFLLSLDTELAWGYFDRDHVRSKKFSSDGSRERKSIEILLDIFDEFGIKATWALVGHLFFEKCKECDICPIKEWEGKYQSYDEIYNSNKSLWYGADIVKTLVRRGAQHEIAFHGYTHRLFDESLMNEEQAMIEVQEWKRVSGGIVPETVIFPRNVVGHLDIFKKSGFICYRGNERPPKPYQLKYIGKLIKHIDQILPITTPQIYDLNELKNDGLINLHPSQYFFGFNRRFELFLDSINLYRVRVQRMIRAVKKAATDKKIIHIWAHPWEFQTEKDFEKLRYLLGDVSDEVKQGRMKSIGMDEMAKLLLNGNIV